MAKIITFSLCILLFNYSVKANEENYSQFENNVNVSLNENTTTVLDLEESNQNTSDFRDNLNVTEIIEKPYHEYSVEKTNGFKNETEVKNKHKKFQKILLKQVENDLSEHSLEELKEEFDYKFKISAKAIHVYEKRIDYLVNKFEDTQNDFKNITNELNSSLNKANNEINIIKQTMNNSLNEANNQINIIKQTMSSSLDKAHKEINNLKQNPVPIGFIYVQLPSQPDPNVLWSLVEWQDVTSQYAGLFFRAEGGASAKFGEKQEDQSPSLNAASSSWTYETYDKIPKHTSIPKNGEWSGRLWVGWIPAGGTADGNEYIKFKLSTGEVRPVNKAIRIWKRIK